MQRLVYARAESGQANAALSNTITSRRRNVSPLWLKTRHPTLSTLRSGRGGGRARATSGVRSIASISRVALSDVEGHVWTAPAVQEESDV
jgi:hypothetical protein